MYNQFESLSKLYDVLGGQLVDSYGEMTLSFEARDLHPTQYVKNIFTWGRWEQYD